MSGTRRLPPRLRAWAHVAQARLRRPGAPTPLPRAAHLVLTWRCNLRCDHCDVWNRPASEELDAARWERVFGQLRSLDILKIIGGEPFVRDDLGEVVEAARRQIDPFILQLVTNGTATDRILRFAERHAWPNLHLRISLDGLEATHDQARGCVGTFAQVMTTLEQLAALRRRRRFQLGVNFILNDRSQPDMDDLATTCRRLGVDLIPGFAVRPFLRHADLTREQASTVGLRDPDQAVRRLEQRDHGARAGFNLAERAFLWSSNQHIFRKQAQGGAALKFSCRELRDLTYLLPNADLITCGLRHEPAGNLEREPFEAVWRGARAEALRAEVDACSGCLQGAVEVMSRLYGG